MVNMGQRLRIRGGSREWLATVVGASVSLDGHAEAFTVTPGPDGHSAIQASPTSTPLDAITARSGDDVWVSIGGDLFVFTLSDERDRASAGSQDADALTPPMSATVVRVAVAPHAEVRKGDVLIVLEAMKMELPIRAPKDAVVKAIRCREGDLVQPGQTLIELS